MRDSPESLDHEGPLETQPWLAVPRFSGHKLRHATRMPSFRRKGGG